MDEWESESYTNEWEEESSLKFAKSIIGQRGQQHNWRPNVPFAGLGTTDDIDDIAGRMRRRSRTAKTTTTMYLQPNRSGRTAAMAYMSSFRWVSKRDPCFESCTQWKVPRQVLYRAMAC